MLERFGGKNITWAMSECLLVDGRRLIVTPGGREGPDGRPRQDRPGKPFGPLRRWPTIRPSYCSPMLFRHAGRRIMANCCSAHGFAVDADKGKLLWTVPLRSPYGVNI